MIDWFYQPQISTPHISSTAKPRRRAWTAKHTLVVCLSARSQISEFLKHLLAITIGLIFATTDDQQTW